MDPRRKTVSNAVEKYIFSIKNIRHVFFGRNPVGVFLANFILRSMIYCLSNIAEKFSVFRTSNDPHSSFDGVGICFGQIYLLLAAYRAWRSLFYSKRRMMIPDPWSVIPPRSPFPSSLLCPYTVKKTTFSLEQKRAGPEFFAEFFVGAQPATAWSRAEEERRFRSSNFCRVLFACGNFWWKRSLCVAPCMRRGEAWGR